MLQKIFFCYGIILVFFSSAINKLIKRKVINSGHGAMSVFVGLRGTAEELGIKAHNIWAFTGWVVHYIIIIQYCNGLQYLLNCYMVCILLNHIS